jgi:hypothetical protein
MARPLIVLMNAAEVNQALADAENGKASALRDQVVDKLMNYKVIPAHQEVVALNRSASAGSIGK